MAKKLLSITVLGKTGAYCFNFYGDPKYLNKWRARIQFQGTEKSLGLYDHFNDAVIARKMAEYDLGFHQNHGA